MTSSTTNSIARCRAQSRASARLWGSDSRSGRPRPRTCPGPTASTARAAHTELSTPPLIATTIPPRRSVSPTWKRSVSAIRRVSAAASSSSRSAIVVDTAPRVHNGNARQRLRRVSGCKVRALGVTSAWRRMAVLATPPIGRRVNGFRQATPFHIEHPCRARATRTVPPFAVDAHRDASGLPAPGTLVAIPRPSHSRGVLRCRWMLGEPPARRPLP